MKNSYIYVHQEYLPTVFCFGVVFFGNVKVMLGTSNEFGGIPFYTIQLVELAIIILSSNIW